MIYDKEVTELRELSLSIAQLYDGLRYDIQAAVLPNDERSEILGNIAARCGIISGEMVRLREKLKAFHEALPAIRILEFKVRNTLRLIALRIDEIQVDYGTIRQATGLFDYERWNNVIHFLDSLYIDSDSGLWFRKCILAISAVSNMQKLPRFDIDKVGIKIRMNIDALASQRASSGKLTIPVSEIGIDSVRKKVFLAWRQNREECPNILHSQLSKKVWESLNGNERICLQEYAEEIRRRKKSNTTELSILKSWSKDWVSRPERQPK